MSYETDDRDEVIDGVPETAQVDSNAPEDRGDVVDSPAIESSEASQPVAADKPAPADTETHKPGIPKARFDEVNEARKEAQRQLEEAQQEIERLRAPRQQTQPSAPDFDEDAKEQEYIDSMLSGEIEKAKAIRRELNAHLQQQAMQAMEQNMTQRQAALALQAESEAAIAAYPYLDTQDGAYPLKLILAARDADIRVGVQPHIALRNAVAAIAPRFQTGPQTTDTPTKVSTSPALVNDTRSRDAVKRGADDSMRQPPTLSQGIGNRTTAVTVDVDSMDEEQFRSLSPAEKKRLRGD